MATKALCMLFQVLFLTHDIGAVVVSWGSNGWWTDQTQLYVNGQWARNGPSSTYNAHQTYTLPSDTRLTAFKFTKGASGAGYGYFFQVLYDNYPWRWSYYNTDCFKCTSDDVSSDNWYDIGYDDSSWVEPQTGSQVYGSWVYPLRSPIYCRHTLPVSANFFDVSAPVYTIGSDAVPISVSGPLNDDNTGTCVAVTDLLANRPSGMLKVSPRGLHLEARCDIKIYGKGDLNCARLKAYVFEYSKEDDVCPNKPGPGTFTTRLHLMSQGPGTNGTDWCEFENTLVANAVPSDCPTCCIGCTAAVVFYLKSSQIQLQICEIVY